MISESIRQLVAKFERGTSDQEGWKGMTQSLGRGIAWPKENQKGNNKNESDSTVKRRT